MSGAIRRPGLVLFDSGDEDVVLARITTQARRDRTDVRLVDWKPAGLIAPSAVRLSKIATIKKSLIDRHLGSLSSKTRKRCRQSGPECLLFQAESYERIESFNS